MLAQFLYALLPYPVQIYFNVLIKLISMQIKISKSFYNASGDEMKLYFWRSGHQVKVSFQTTPSPNFFFGIDQQGALAETGWFLYPSFSFINWQAQWWEHYHPLVLVKPSISDLFCNQNILRLYLKLNNVCISWLFTYVTSNQRKTSWNGDMQINQEK